MKTRKEMIAQGYEVDWASECPICHTWDCHQYKDCLFCNECKKKVGGKA
jgi:hypothetical protein